ncbi:MAG: hypothetical protein K8H88_33070, partial [Sandaracinaceae bacterium]|nr:hypothetical protein [Sandaracinaceae bacterium]
ERVEELARQILQIDAESALAAYELGLVLLRRGRGAEALEWAERGATLDPRDPRHLLLQGDIHRRGSRLGVAREKWQACLLLNPRYTPCQRRLDETAGL